jgi:hypothetical protein
MENRDIQLYRFSTKIATDAGFEESVMLWNICFWVLVNQRNNHNYHDGKYWTYDTVKKYSEQYPFWSVAQIRRILKNLETKGYIETGRYNKRGYDKTKWYTVTEKTLGIIKKSDVLK